jgi:hypothetical protein
MTTWYRVTRWSKDIEPIEVVKETEKTLTIVTMWFDKKINRVCRKDGSNEGYFRTWQDALSELIRYQEANIKHHTDELARATSEWNRLKRLPELRENTDACKPVTS